MLSPTPPTPLITDLPQKTEWRSHHLADTPSTVARGDGGQGASTQAMLTEAVAHLDTAQLVFLEVRQ